MDRNEYYTKVREALSHIPENKGNEMYNHSSVFNSSIQSLIRGTEPSILLFHLSNIIEEQSKELEKLLAERTHVVYKTIKSVTI